MKRILMSGIAIIMLATPLITKAQDTRELVRQGIELNNAHDYNNAIEKYKAALNIDANNVPANYQMAFSLVALNKGQEALPYLQKVTQAGASATVLSSTYGLMAGIYDKNGQTQKAIDSYQQAIKLDSANYALHYGLGLAYFRNHQYGDAELSAARAMHLDLKQAAPMRLYGLVTFHQNKRAAALLGLCSFLWLNPNGLHSDEANENIQHILQGGNLKPEPGVLMPHFIEANTDALNQAITRAVNEADKRKHSSAANQFNAQLQAIFISVGQLAEKQIGNNAFFKQLASYYYQLAQTPHMQTFAFFIRQSTDKAAAEWLAAHPQEVSSLKQWAAEHQLIK